MKHFCFTAKLLFLFLTLHDFNSCLAIKFSFHFAIDYSNCNEIIQTLLNVFFSNKKKRVLKSSYRFTSSSTPLDLAVGNWNRIAN